MYRIMFVCHGNICRSPMAEMILKDMVKKRGLGDRFVIASSATSTEEIIGGVGNPIYPPARAELEKHHIVCEPHRAVQLCLADYEKYDLFIGMDNMNIRNMGRILRGDPEGKIRKLLQYTGTDADVADPWYSGRFDVTYGQITRACAALLEQLAE